MAFQKGVPRHANAGRKKGSLNKSKILKVSDYLASNDINPVAKLMLLIPQLEPRDQAKIWMDLVSYCQAKPSVYEESEEPTTGEDLLEEFKEVTNEALKLVAGGKGSRE